MLIELITIVRVIEWIEVKRSRVKRSGCTRDSNLLCIELLLKVGIVVSCSSGWSGYSELGHDLVAMLVESG
jgi:hypothetical protein